jgi:hypothetical protein
MCESCRKLDLRFLWNKTETFLVSFTYRKVTSSSLPRLVAHFQIFRKLMKGKFDACVVTFGQKVPKLNSILVYCSQLYSIWFWALLLYKICDEFKRKSINTKELFSQNFKVSLHFWQIWPTVRRDSPAPTYITKSWAH